jgi:hypothetical protein
MFFSGKTRKIDLSGSRGAAGGTKFGDCFGCFLTCCLLGDLLTSLAADRQRRLEEKV